MRQFIASMVLAILPATPAYASGELIGGDLTFKGTVAAHGCSIVPSSKNIAVDFGQISTRTLYAERNHSPKRL
jgi:type 1 fimbria pilin